MQANQGFRPVGFRIYGSVDVKHQYDIFLKPGETQVQGSFKCLKHNHDTKEPVTIDFGKLLDWQTATNIFLTDQPHIEMHKRIFFKRPFLPKYIFKHSDKSKMPAPQIYLQVDGTCGEINYTLWFNARDKTDCQGCVYTSEGSSIPKKVIIAPEIQALPFDQLKRMLFDPYPCLKIDINGDYEICINAPQHKLSLKSTDCKPPNTEVVELPFYQKIQTEQESAPSVLSVHDVISLAHAVQLGTKDSLLDIILNQMVEIFVERRNPSTRFIQEITAVYPPLDQDSCQRVLNSLLLDYKTLPIKEHALLDSLATIFTSFQRMVYQRAVDQIAFKDSKATEEISLELLDNIDRANLVNMLVLLTNELHFAHHQKNDVILVKKLLKTIIPLLDIMTMRGVTDVEANAHNAAYQAISEFEKNDDLEVRYLAHYGMQAFTLIPNNVSNLQSFGNRSYHLLRALATIASGISLDPRALFGLGKAILDSVDDFKKVFEHQEWQQNWFVQLLYLRHFVFNQAPGEFFNAMETLTKDNKLNTRDPQFIFGYLDLLWDMLHLPKLSTRDIEAKKAALHKMLQILDINTNGKKGQYFIKDPSMQKQLCELLIQRLYQCKTHFQDEISNEAKIIIAQNSKLFGKQPKEIPFITQLQKIKTGSLYTLAASIFAPLLESMQNVKEEVDSDSFLKRDIPVFLPLNAINLGDRAPTAKPLATLITEALSNENRSSSIVVTAESGGGKTLSFKVLSKKLLQQYKEENYFPLYGSMKELHEPENALNKMLKNHGIDKKQQKVLKERKVVFIFDDCKTMPYTEDGKINFDIKQIKGMESWKKAKFIFLCKKGLVNPERFRTNKPVQSIFIQPLNNEQIYQYMQKEGVLDRLEEQINALKKDPKAERFDWHSLNIGQIINSLMQSKFWQLFTNPFFLKIGLKILSETVFHYFQKHPNADLKDIFSHTPAKEICEKLIETYVSENALELSRLSRNTNYNPPEKFIQYQVKLAAAMKKHQWEKIPWPTNDEKVKQEFKELFDSNEEMLKECLMYTENGWKFKHDEFLNFFTELSEPENHAKLSALLENLTKRDLQKIYTNDV